MTDCTSVLLQINKRRSKKPDGAFDRSYSRIRIRKNFGPISRNVIFGLENKWCLEFIPFILVLFWKTVDRTHLKLRKNGQQRATCFATLQEKQLEKRCCAFYHPRSKLLTTWFVARHVLRGSRNITIQLALHQ